MIREIAVIEIRPGTEKDYEAAIAKATALPPIPGFHGFELHRSLERPQRYRLWRDGTALPLTKSFVHPPRSRNGVLWSGRTMRARPTLSTPRR